MPDMARLKLYLLGRFQATLDESPLAGLRSGKSRALLAYLAGEAGRPHQRSALATLLRGEHPEEAARLSLRVALSSLRDALAPLQSGQGHPALLEITPQSVQLNPVPELCWVDAGEFDARLAASTSHAHPAITRCPACLHHLTEAVALYRGDFVTDLAVDDGPAFEEWRLLCQERYHRQAIGALEQIAQHYLALNAFPEAQRHARQLLTLEPWHETAHRQLMRALALDGQRNAALLQYAACRRALADELGAEPEPETTALWSRIRDGALAQAGASNLAAPLTPFIGREAEREQIAGWLNQPACRLVTLVGTSGIGKTRLALAAAAQHEALFPDGICFAPMPAADSPDANDLVLAEALQLPLTRNGSTPKVQLLGYLHNKELLLVLDDLRPSPAIANWVVDLLQRAPQIKILATASQRLNVRGECLLRVAGLTFPAAIPDPAGCGSTPKAACSAVELFVQSACRVQPDFSLTAGELPHVARICQLVEGMPLAIELAATWIPTMTCAEIAAEITRDPDFLTTSLQDIPERHRSLRAVFDYSWGLLSAAEQAVLGRLSVFQRGFDRASAGAVAGATLPILASLTDKALLRRERCLPQGRPVEDGADDSSPASQSRDGEAGCYNLHELVRQYAARCLSELPDEPAATQSRHSSYFLAFLAEQQVTLIGAGQLEALAEITQRSDNIRAAWDWAVAHGRWDELEKALPGRFLFCYMRSWFQEGLAAFGRLADALAERADARWDALYGSALASQGWFAFLTGRGEQAQVLFERGLAHLRAANGGAALAFILAYRGAMALHQGDIATARAAGTESLARHEANGDRYGMTVACDILGKAAHQTGDYNEAERQCQRGLEIARTLGNRWSIAFSLELLGRIALAQANCHVAGELFAESLAIRREMRDRRGCGLALNLLGDVRLACGAAAEAERCYREALGIFQALGYQSGAENAQAGLAEALNRAMKDV